MNEVHSVSVVKEMIDLRYGWVQCEIVNIDHVDFVINDLCIN